MREVIASALVIGMITPHLVAAQARGSAASGARIRACSLLTRDLVMKVGTVEGKRVVDLLPPMEDELGAKGTACEYGGIGLQIDPFARPDDMRKSLGANKDMTSVAGVGDSAYFRNNKNQWAELMVWSGTHHFTIQMGVPMGATAESIKPNTIALANAIIPQLR